MGLVAASSGYSLVVHRFLIAVTSVVAEHRLQGAQASVAVASGFSSTSSVAGVHGFSCPTACGIVPDQGLNLFLLHWQVDYLPLSHPENPQSLVFIKRRDIYSIILYQRQITMILRF